MKVMSTPLSKLLQEQVRDPASVWRSGIVDVITISLKPQGEVL
jgi:hypothetical protein